MNIYLTDGTMIGFYTAVFDAWKTGGKITSDGNIQLGIGDTLIKVLADEEKFIRVRRRIDQTDRYAAGDVDLALRSNLTEREQAAFDYIRLLIEYGRPIRKMLAERPVMKLNDLIYKVLHELDKQRGFIRFKETAEGILYAPYSPDNDITDLLAKHFKARLGALRFVIHDLGRAKAAVSNGQNWIMVNAERAEISLSESEAGFEKLWKEYYRNVNISERKNEKLMRASMPVRYWKFLPEKN